MSHRSLPEMGELWKQYDGNLFLIVGIAQDLSHGGSLVVYRETGKGTLMWVSPLGEFLGIECYGNWRFERSPDDHMVPL